MGLKFNSRMSRISNGISLNFIVYTLQCVLSIYLDVLLMELTVMRSFVPESAVLENCGIITFPVNRTSSAFGELIPNLASLSDLSIRTV